MQDRHTVGDGEVDVVRLAETVARYAHAGQVDKAGRPYIDHPVRVAARLADPHHKAIALLHDVVEDSDLTLDDLRAAGLPERVVAGVAAITRRPGQNSAAYLEQVAGNDDAATVKNADMDDNSDPDRLALLDPAVRSRLQLKYERNKARLDELRSR